jgi:preprotein translocase subunit SecG
MLYNFLLVILIIDAVVLVTAILLQAGKGSGLAANFGGASSSPDAFIGIRQAGTILTKATWWCAGIFLGLAFILQVMSTRASAPRSVLEKTFSNQPAPAAPTPATTAPAVPLEPATGGTPAPGGSAGSTPPGGGTTPAGGAAAVPLSPAPAPATPPPATPKKK